jgi:biotin carboxylase
LNELHTEAPTLFCISTYEKGQPFLREAARLGADVVFLTVDKLRDADWPREAFAEFHTVPEAEVPEHQSLDQIRRVVEDVARRRKIARIVALDEFDLESASLLREHLRLPGMGYTATRLFRDKLAMRGAAQAGGVRVPEFTGVFNDADVRHFIANTQGPWLMKPRWSASAIGIRKIASLDDVLWARGELGERATDFLLERFVPGAIYHVEGITSGGKLQFASGHKYGQPPMQTMHDGGVFTTRTLDRTGEEESALEAVHAATLQALGMQDGVTHSEFIRAHADGQFYFLETAARVGGAFIADVVEHASGVNPWVEWARIEVALALHQPYRLPPLRREYAGSVICLARQQEPDLSAYVDPEIVYRLKKFHHAGLIVRSPQPERVEQLVDSYGRRFLDDFYARMDAPAKPTS